MYASVGGEATIYMLIAVEADSADAAEEVATNRFWLFSDFSAARELALWGDEFEPRPYHVIEVWHRTARTA